MREQNYVEICGEHRSNIFFPKPLNVLGLLTEAPAPKGLSIIQRRISGLLASEGDYCCDYQL